MEVFKPATLETENQDANSEFIVNVDISDDLKQIAKKALDKFVTSKTDAEHRPIKKQHYIMLGYILYNALKEIEEYK